MLVKGGTDINFKSPHCTRNYLVSRQPLGPNDFVKKHRVWQCICRIHVFSRFWFDCRFTEILPEPVYTHASLFGCAFVAIRIATCFIVSHRQIVVRQQKWASGRDGVSLADWFTVNSRQEVAQTTILISITRTGLSLGATVELIKHELRNPSYSFRHFYA